ncbi:hypothetical protein INR49_021584 [Caranx melampygus]|nr:hypothetical protein INR49_021584 [Caranx melampygus]
MPSDFISLLSSDLDLNSPKSLYSKESVYDLLPKELQLQPSSTQTDPPTMSQKSGGEAGPPPSAALASDATSSTSSPSASSSLAIGVPSTGPSTSSSDHLKVPPHLHSTGGDGAGASEMQGMEGAISAPSRSNSGANTAAGDIGSGVLSGLGVQQPQNTPSKRRPVLSISPPPEDLFDDSQMSCQEEPTISGPAGPDSEHSSSMWADDSVSNFSLISSISYNDNTEVPRKSRKRTPRQRPGPKPAPPEDSMDVFDADSAKAPHFVLSQLGTDKSSAMSSSLESGTATKGGSLSAQFPQKSDGKELKILVQPETQHRARYLTEGSRGSVKDRTQQGFPTVKLEGVTEPVVLQVFVANDAGRVKPHGFYQACRVTGRNTTACKEVDIEGTTVIEIPLEPSSDMTLAVDCNHLIVTVPPFHNQSITSPVSVGIFVMTNAGRSHDAQPFTYTPDPADNSNVRTIKTEGPSLVKTCIFDGQMKSMSSERTDCSSQPSKRQEDTPMEVSSNPPPTDVFKTSPDPLVSVQQTLELSSSPHPGGESFQSPMPLQPEDVDLPQAPPVFPSLESLSTIQKQDIAPTTSFPVSGDTTIPPVTPEVPQQFLRDPQDSLPPENSNNSGGVVVVAMPQIATPAPPQSQQSQVPLFPQEGVAQLERAVRELQAGGNTTLQQVLEAALFQSPRPLAETQGSQQQVQAALLQNTLTVLTGGSLNSEQQSPGSTLYLSPNPQPQQQQQQQLAFISSMETSTSQPQPVAMFQNQSQAQLSQMQQQSTPMEQQQSAQQNQQQPPQLPMGQQGSLFQSIPNHSQTNPVSQSQQTGLLLCTTDLNPQAIPPTILFSTQPQGPSPIGSISVGIPQPDPAEPMSFQDQSSSGSNSTSTENQQQSLFQEQQPMQVGPSPSSVPSSQPVELFLPQTSLSGLQSTIGSQELNNQAPAPGTTIFVVQGGVGVVANPGQQPPEQLFQTTVGGNVAPQGQANLFVFGIQNDSPQLLNSSGSTLPAQSQPQNTSHMQPLLDQPMTQAASPMPATMHSSLQNTLQAQMQSSLENAIQTTLQNAMQTNTQTALQSSLQATIETSLPTPMQTNLQTQIQSSLQNQLQASISTSSNMDKIEDILESLQK